jgi:bacterioferritin-associated ferredoxin
VELDDKICYCFHVRKRKILSFIRIHKPRVASQISECGGAGTGCGWCIPFLKKYFDRAQSEKPADDDGLTPEEYAARRGAYIRAGKGTPPPGATPTPSADGNDANSSRKSGHGE